MNCQGAQQSCAPKDMVSLLRNLCKYLSSTPLSEKYTA